MIYPKESNKAPLYIVGRGLWLDAKDPSGDGTQPANASQITTLKDKFGLGDATQGTSANKPVYNTTGINNMPSITFANADKFMTVAHRDSLNYDTTSGCTIFLVLKASGYTSHGSGINCFYGKGDGAIGTTGYNLQISSNNKPQWQPGANEVTDPTAWDSIVGDSCIITTSMDNANTDSFIYYNGISVTPNTSSTVGSDNSSDFTLGSATGSTTRNANFEFGELIIYNRLLSTEERLYIHRYLANKWGINVLTPKILTSATALASDVTFTRATTAYAFVGTTYTSFAINTPRFGSLTIDGADAGLVIEGSRTNSFRNSTMIGSTNGVAGSGGVLPTNWIFSGAIGMNYEVIGTGTTNGMNYIDLRLFGTAGISSGISWQMESNTQIVTTNGTTWSNGMYVSLVAGSIANINNIVNSIRCKDSGGTTLQTFSTSSFKASLSATPFRTELTATMANASTARVNAGFEVTFTNGAIIDATFRLMAPQLELGAFCSSFIPTSTVAVTRSADDAFFTNLTTTKSWWNALRGTFYAKWKRTSQSTGSKAVMCADNTFAERIDLLQDSTISVVGDMVLAASQNCTVQKGGFSANVSHKAAFAFELNNAAIAVDATSVVTDTVCQPGNPVTLKLGTDFAGSYLFGTIQEAWYFDERVINNTLIKLTAS